MAKRTDLAITGSDSPNGASFVPQAKDEKLEPKTDDISALKGNIEQTRGEMSRTVDEIEQRLSPAHIKEQIADVKDSLVAQYHDAKQHIKEDIVTEVREAKDKVKEEIGDAKQMVQEQLTHAKDVDVDATVGRVKEMAVDVKDIAVDAGHAVRDVAVDAGHAMEAAGSSVMASIRRNPVPVALLAVGAGWLAVNLLRGSSKPPARQRRYDGGYDRRALSSPAPSRDLLHRVGDTASQLGHRVADTASDARDRAVDAMHDATDRVGDLGHRVSDGAANMAHSAGEAVSEVRDRAVDLVHDAGDSLYRAEETLVETFAANPLPFGAVALAVGAAVGLALPHTAREDAWMGESKERLLHSAGEMAQGAIHKVQEQAANLTGQASV